MKRLLFLSAVAMFTTTAFRNDRGKEDAGGEAEGPVENLGADTQAGSQGEKANEFAGSNDPENLEKTVAPGQNEASQPLPNEGAEAQSTGHESAAAEGTE
jgi:hypothetical protein